MNKGNSVTQTCRESDVTKERIQKLLKAGANVILTTKGIDDMALKVGTRLLAAIVFVHARQAFLTNSA